MGKNNDFEKIVGYAVRVPSKHNSQPWKFRVSTNSIEVHPNFDCSLPVVDKNNRQLYVSLGCVIENIRIAANQFGYDCVRGNLREHGAVIWLRKTEKVYDDSLFQQIPKRQTNRGIYLKQKISKNVLDTISSIAVEPGIHFYFTEVGNTFSDTLIQYIIKGNEIQMKDRAYLDELISWIRFNEKEVNETNNGLTYKILNIPSLPSFFSFITKIIPQAFFSPAKQNKSDIEKINSSSHLVLFTTKNNTLTEWINLGQTFQRFLLKSTEQGIAVGCMNQPCEVASLAANIQQLLPVNKEFPTLLLRIGYANPMPYSLRNPVDLSFKSPQERNVLYKNGVKLSGSDLSL